MSILQGLFRKTNDDASKASDSYSKATIAKVRHELTDLKYFIITTNSSQRVTKKQRDALMTRIINVLDTAEYTLARASNE